MVDYGAGARAFFRLRRLARTSCRGRVLTRSPPQPTRAATAAGTDQLLLDIADYVIDYELQSPEALQTARYALLDSLGAAAPAFAPTLAASLPPSRRPPALTGATAPQAARCWR
jgi:hypothetical protein